MGGFLSPLLGLHPFNFNNPGLRVGAVSKLGRNSGRIVT